MALPRSCLSLEELDHTCKLLDETGFVILTDAVPLDVCDKLHVKLKMDFAQMKPAKYYENYTKGHIQQDAPTSPEFVFREVVANPLVLQIVDKVLGKGSSITLYSGNTNAPGSEDQPLHTDVKHLWPHHHHPPAQLIVNFVFEDVTEHNGSIELYPGTHKVVDFETDEEYRIRERDYIGRSSVRGNMKKGSVLIRDNRLWHRGRHNSSDQPRHMLAIVYTINWMKKSDIFLGNGCQEVFEGTNLDIFNLKFRTDDINYLHL